MVMAGMAEKVPAKYFRSAAPVGVHISEAISPAYTGIPSSILAVAGAGTGRIPCVHRTVPLPTLTGLATTRSG